MTILPAHPRIPYGEANFQRIRLKRWLYVDNTLPASSGGGALLLLIAPAVRKPAALGGDS